MGSAAKPKLTTPKADVDQFLLVQAAKTQFITSTMNLGWRLAVTVVVPIVAGVKLDEKFDAAPSYTLTGLFIAVFAGCLAVWGTIKEVNANQAEQAAKLSATGKARRAK